MISIHLGALAGTWIAFNIRLSEELLLIIVVSLHIFLSVRHHLVAPRRAVDMDLLTRLATLENQLTWF